MPSQTTTPTLQACPNCGAGAPLDAHFCPQCTKILPLGRRRDYFSFFGVPRTLTIAAADLEARFRTLSRQFHPDYFYNATPAERRASLERSSYLNDAYRTLREPASRIEYLIGLELDTPPAGRPDGASPERPRGAAAPGTPTVPPALLEEVFALNEELDDIRAARASGMPAEAWQARLETARQPIDAKRRAHEQELQRLSQRWDALVESGASGGERRAVAAALRDRMLERNYINNLLAGIERELAQ